MPHACLFSLSDIWNWLYNVLVLLRPPCFPLDGVDVLLVSLSRLRLRVEPTPLSCRYTPSERRWCESPDDISRELGVCGHTEHSVRMRGLKAAPNPQPAPLKPYPAALLPSLGALRGFDFVPRVLPALRDLPQLHLQVVQVLQGEKSGVGADSPRPRGHN